MSSSNAARPTSVITGESTAVSAQDGTLLDTPHIPTPIIAQLVGNDVAIANGIKASGALDLCRRLIAAGAHHNSALVCYRGDCVALRVRSIGIGAKFTVREDGLRVVPWKAFSPRTVRPAMRQNTQPVRMQPPAQFANG